MKNVQQQRINDLASYHVYMHGYLYINQLYCLVFSRYVGLVRFISFWVLTLNYLIYKACQLFKHNTFYIVLQM